MPPLRRRMVARDPGEPHRVSTPLELLFDLTFVDAVYQAVQGLAGGTEDGRLGDSITPFLMTFFAIWWVWMNFTWFASAYDVDDVPYRLTVFVQLAGVLILAAGVPSAFAGDVTTMTMGYLVMRVGLVALWLRAAAEDPAGRATALRYAVGLSVTMAFWVARLALPDQGPTWVFFILAALDLSVPPIAERSRATRWHPRHMAERYGLFTIILLGESVFASTYAVERAVAQGVGAELITIALAGLAILFALWWIYFLEPAAERLEGRRDPSFLWWYGHYVFFAALAAIGGGLETAVASYAHHGEAGPRLVAASVTVPVAIVLVMLWALNAPIRRMNAHPALLAATAVLVLLATFAAPTAGVPGTLLLIAALLALFLTTTLVRQAPSRRTAGPAE
ncbi:low temperature requirement protein A [Actinomadura sp. WMMA1423]|uniref:low temperature requirement protein A n=1 Tax=Actinomadura sp. WMMA1423 TaxID=2591108 RepID=UPI00197AB853|nr:low temperature requirement protein A [Actinomadura sp. WMMA1423]